MASVLVVDDEPDLRYLAQINLELDGHRVMTAANGAEALAAVSVELPDVVLLDVMMPEVDGWTVLQQLKNHLDEDIAAVRVLMMTALGADDDRLRGGVEGAVRYLVKPVSPDAMRAAVRDVLDGTPEKDQRRTARTASLVELARRERGAAGSDLDAGPRPRLSRLERPRGREVVDTAGDDRTVVGRDLTEKQRELLQVLRDTASVSEAAARLGVSRSNVYASLRRVARKLDISSVPDLLRLLRSGELRVVEE